MVSKAWSEKAAAVIFLKSRIYFGKEQDRKLNAIINGPPDGFLVNVRHLTLHSPSWDRPTKTGLRRLFRAIKKNTLVSLFSDIELSSSTVSCLLGAQSNLQVLGLAKLPQSPNGLPGSQYIRNNLSQLSELSISVINAFSDHLPLETWFAHSPSLRTLKICGSPGRRGGKEVFNGWIISECAPPLELSHFELSYLCLNPRVNEIPARLHLPTLRILHIRKCKLASKLLLEFGTAYRSSKHKSLDEFVFRSRGEKDDSNYTERFLKRLDAVKVIKLSFDATNVEYLPPPSTFETIGHAIRVLHITSSFPGSHYNVDTLKCLCRMCPSVEVLCLDLVDISRDIDDLHEWQDFRLPAYSKVSTSLSVLRGSLVGACTRNKKSSTDRQIESTGRVIQPSYTAHHQSSFNARYD